MPTLVRERLRAPRTFVAIHHPPRPAKVPAPSVEETTISVSTYVHSKALLSPLIGVLLAIPGLPIIAVLYVLVRLTSKGPGFYRQVRSGRDGERFTIWKLRTMVVDAERSTGPVWAAEDDPRVTLVGRFLRKYHLDELPQILNIIMGHMVLVGPRPERPEIEASLRTKVPMYAQRLAVKPGVTGMAQVHLPADQCVESVRRKLSYDLTYVQYGTFWLDCRIVAGTMLKLVPFMSWLIQPAARCHRFMDRAANLLHDWNRAVSLSSEQA